MSLTVTGTKSSPGDVKLLQDPQQRNGGEKKSSRVKSLDGMRLYIQTWIILGHYWFDRDPKNYVFHRFIDRAGSGVTFYIVLSGVMTNIGYRKLSLMEYYARRLIPMIALNQVALLAGAAPVHYGEWNFWRTVFMIDTWSRHYPHHNGPLWTLGTLLWCWIMFPPFMRYLYKSDQKTRMYMIPIVFLLASIPWILGSTLPEGDTYGEIHWIRAAPYVRFWDFLLGAIVSCFIKEEFLFHNRFSWVWFYVADVAIAIIVIWSMLAPCVEENCRGGFEYVMLEGPVCFVLWLLVIYSFFYKHEVTNVGICRRIFNHSTSLELSRQGVPFCAYVLQQPLSSRLAGDYPITFFICLWTIAILVNDCILFPLTQSVRSWFPKYKIAEEPHDELTGADGAPTTAQNYVEKNPITKNDGHVHYGTSSGSALEKQI